MSLPVEPVVPSVVDVEDPPDEVVDSVVAEVLVVPVVETLSLVEPLVELVEPLVVVDEPSVVDEFEAESEDVDVVGAGSLLITPVVDELSADPAQWLPVRGVAPGGHSVADGAMQPAEMTSGRMRAGGVVTRGMAGDSLSSSRG